MNRLRALRESCGLSQQKLADQTNLTQQKIHAYETEANEPDMETWKVLADFFDTSIDYLVGNTSVKRKLDCIQTCDLTSIEIEFLEKFRQLPPSRRNTLSLFLDTLLDKA